MPTRRASLSSVYLLAVACLWLGCSPAEPPPGDVIGRWIDVDPQTPLSTPDLVSAKLESDLGPTDQGAAARWRGHDLRILGIRDGSLEFEQAGDDPWLATDVSLDAAEIVAVEVELTDPGPVEAQLFWAGRWQRFSMRRMERPASTRPVGSGTLVYRFDVGNNPEWRGRVTSLRVDAPPDAGRPTRLGAVRIYRWEGDPERLEEAVLRPWKVDLAGSTRNALLAPPGTSWDLSIDVPDDASLVLSHGVQTTVGGAVAFRVTALEDDRAPQVLYRETVRPASFQAGAWIDAVVDLGSLAGRSVTLQLATEALGDYPDARGFPVWGNPEVVAPAAAPAGPNVIVVLLDTLRADRLSCYGHPLPTSPRIDRWAGRSAVRFANVVAPAPWTLPSHVSLFSGLDALRHGVNFWGSAPPSLDMLAEILRRSGCTTAAVTGGGLLHPDFGFAQGFDRFDTWGEPDSGAEVAWVFDQARRWIDANRHRRFFLFVHTYETHAPHRRRQPDFDRLARAAGVAPPDFDLELFTRPWDGLVARGDSFRVRRRPGGAWTDELTEVELETVGLMYDSAVATVDDEVGRLLDHLRARGLEDRTVVAVTSDHGEALGEDGRAGHSYLEDYNLMVPLILELPGGAGAGDVVDTQVRLVDLMPTLLEAAGAGSAAAVDGRSLLPLIAEPSSELSLPAWAYAASSNQGLALRIDNALKYRFPDPAWAEVAHREGLFDLRASPDEHHNLAPGDPRLTTLRTVTRSTVLEQHQGLRLEIRNGGDGVLSGRLVGAWAAHDRVKTAEHGLDGVHWRPDSPASFELEPGRESTLLFAQLTSAEAGVEVRTAAADGAPGEAALFDFDLTELRTPSAILLTAEGWTLVEDFSGTLETGLLIFRVGDARSVVSPGVPLNAEVRERLEALGYLE